ncbi:MAG TPA: iron-containing alcohol dehydrogenase [Syntrophales bacterium]|nr:iron-containing alcohol dehydrogenase [Syntrophales bacterium]
MKSRFNFFIPTRILFGPGKLADLGSTPFLPGKRALVVISSGGSMRKQGYLDRLVAALEKNGVSYTVYDKILPNPISRHVEEGARVAMENRCDFVVGLGGGSSIDSAKSIAVMARNPGEYWDYVIGGSGKGKKPLGGALPIVAIPTTAGTGTESDLWTVITKTETREKIGWGADCTFPVLSVVDPELMLSVPPELTAYQGMDAFFHAAEGYLARANQPASDRFALEAIGLITKHLPEAVKDGGNLEARTALAWASTEAGFVESLSCCISHHSLEHAISAFHPEVPHGAGLIMTSMAYFTYLAERSPARFADMAAAMGENTAAMKEGDRPFAFITALGRLIERVGMAGLGPETFGIRKDEAAAIVKNAMETMGGLFALTPVKFSAADAETIFENCFR